jgi:hypothetical protein
MLFFLKPNPVPNPSQLDPESTHRSRPSFKTMHLPTQTAQLKEKKKNKSLYLKHSRRDPTISKGIKFKSSLGTRNMEACYQQPIKPSITNLLTVVSMHHFHHKKIQPRSSPALLLLLFQS